MLVAIFGASVYVVWIAYVIEIVPNSMPNASVLRNRAVALSTFCIVAGFVVFGGISSAVLFSSGQADDNSALNGTNVSAIASNENCTAGAADATKKKINFSDEFIGAAYLSVGLAVRQQIAASNHKKQQFLTPSIHRSSGSCSSACSLRFCFLR